jgi:hypothetical protein
MPFGWWGRTARQAPGGGVIYVLLVLVHLSEVPRQEINNLIGGAHRSQVAIS